MKEKLLPWQKKIIKKLNQILNQATQQDNLTSAIQCIKLITSIYSLTNDKIENNISLDSLSKTDLEKLIEEGNKKFKS